MNATAMAAGAIVLGVAAGVLGGMFGIGGGLILVPALILAFGLDPTSATGTSLVAQLLPVGLLGTIAYWRSGKAQVGTGLWIAAGLTVGVLIGARINLSLPQAHVKRAYGLFLLIVAAYFLFAPEGVKPRQPAAAPPLAMPDDPAR